MTYNDKIQLILCAMIKKLDDDRLSDLEKDNIVMLIERLEMRIQQ